MKLREAVVIFGLLACVSCGRSKPNVTLLPCESPEAEAAAQVALDFINGQHTHGYKYALNQVEDIQVTKAGDNEFYLLELEFLETECHILDPTPVPQCVVRKKINTAIEADCDVVLSKHGEQFSVEAFKCKTEPETHGPCGGCFYLVPLNDTDGVQVVHDSLALFNQNNTYNTVFALLEIGRLSAQVVALQHNHQVEFAIIETNCTTSDDGICTPLEHNVARHGFCHSKTIGDDTKVDCNLFVSPDLGVNLNATLPAPPLLHAHTAGPGYSPKMHSLTHHSLTALHSANPNATSLLSSESDSAEVKPVVKREVAVDAPPPPPQPSAAALPAGQGLGVPLLPRCPGKVKHFD